MRCRCCGLFSSVAGMAAGRWRGRVRGAWSRQAGAPVTVRTMHWVPTDQAESLGDSVHARGADAPGVVVRDADVRG